jgi:hypothetical protein
MGVATGNTIHSTRFTLPPWIEPGASELCVIANGIASALFAVTVGRQAGIRAIAPDADSRLELFAVGKDGDFWHLWQTAPSNSWSSWASHGSAGGSFGISL